MNEKFKVDFIGVGMPRAGTTWIYNCLKEHPEICISRDKEVHFFDFNFAKGIEYYKSFFEHCGKEKIKGEFTAGYFSEEKTLQRIKEAFPDVKIIVSLRNPVERAFSHYLYRKRTRGWFKKFSDVLDNDPINIISTGFYYKHLLRIYKYFNPEQVLVVIHDESKQNPQKFIQEIFRFLGVNILFKPSSLFQEMNQSKDFRYWFPQFEWLILRMPAVTNYKIGRTFAGLMRLIDPFNIITKIIWNIRNFNVRIGAWQEEEILPDDMREYLKKLYAEDILNLEKLLNRELVSWR